MRSSDWAIDLCNVAKTYNRKVHALRGVDIRVGRGEIFGLLGPNGAGKSTLVKIMMTVVLPDRAKGTLLGHPLGHIPTLRRVGYLPEGHRFPPYLTGLQVLVYFGRLSGVPGGPCRQRAKQWLSRLGMQKWANTRVTQYSKGMLQRVGVAQALLHDPDLVVLDEPTDGVDPIGRKEIREIMLELKSEGKSIFINSHILSELEMICDRVAILVEGQVVRQGTVSELTAHSVACVITACESLEKHRTELEALGASVDGCALTLKTEDASEVNRVIDLIRSRGVLLESVQPKRWSLEDVFLDAASRISDQ